MRPLLLLVAFLAMPVSAASAQVYNDLPGVRPQEPLNAPSKVACEQVIVKRGRGVEPDRGPRYETLYECSRENGPVFSSPQLPPSLYREKRGLDY